MKSGRVFKTVDEYLSEVPTEQRTLLQQIRSTVKKLVPELEEKISYNMPMFYLDGMFVAYAAFKNHCSFFPCSKATLRNFEKELSSYKTSAGTVQFTIDHPIPTSLLKKIIAARAAEKAKAYTASPRGKFDLPRKMGKPAERALANANITNLKQLSKWSEDDITELHGVGPKALGILHAALKTNKLSFSKK
jgi:uncharacterized protein YdhG (YjbR/CyaY superfamily)